MLDLDDVCLSKACMTQAERWTRKKLCKGYRLPGYLKIPSHGDTQYCLQVKRRPHNVSNYVWYHVTRCIQFLSSCPVKLNKYSRTGMPKHKAASCYGESACERSSISWQHASTHLRMYVCVFCKLFLDI